ncbi:MAG TPA: HAD family hydrolase [Chloroflexota bacterium]|nr:HAD family hydrolase [Chloroflexota bacterium]
MTDLVFLLDVDNTLLDNDRLKADLDLRIGALLGPEAANQFWEVYESVRRGEQYVDFPGTLAEFTRLHPDLPNDDLRALILDMPFQSYAYPGASEAIRYLATIGVPVILSDGDPVFQLMKIEKSGMAPLVEGRVILTIHKQDEMDAVFERFPAAHYAMIDDKTTILADCERRYPRLITTVLVCQGKYARIHASPPPDLVVPHIGDLVSVPPEEFLTTGHRAEDSAG